MSINTPEQTCVYVTRGWGVHDDRWRRAIGHLGYTTICVNAEKHNADNLKSEVEKVAGSITPVVAGPLDSVTQHLIGIKAPLIGLSWGFDLHHMDDRSWLIQLTGLIVDSAATKTIAEHAGVLREDITVLPWGVDLRRFTPSGPSIDPRKWDLDPTAPIICSLRAHEPLYRVHDIIDAFASISAQHPHAALLIGHDGSITSELQERANQTGLSDRIRFIGRLPESDLPQLLRASTMYVTASEVDGTSVTMLQAMACGTPVIASDTPGNGEWITQKTGLLFQTGSPQSLAEQVNQVFFNPAMVQQRAEQARQLVTQEADWQANQSRLGAAIAAASAKARST